MKGDNDYKISMKINKHILLNVKMKLTTRCIYKWNICKNRKILVGLNAVIVKHKPVSNINGV